MALKGYNCAVKKGSFMAEEDDFSGLSLLTYSNSMK
jgi:hypothetical protein